MLHGGRVAGETMMHRSTRSLAFFLPMTSSHEVGCTSGVADGMGSGAVGPGAAVGAGGVGASYVDAGAGSSAGTAGGSSWGRSQAQITRSNGASASTLRALLCECSFIDSPCPQNTSLRRTIGRAQPRLVA